MPTIAMQQLIRPFYKKAVCVVKHFKCVAILLLLPILCRAQMQTMQLNYHISHAGKKIGWMKVNANVTGNRKTIYLISEIKIRKLIYMRVISKDSSSFENSTLLFASQYRTMNGNVSLNKQTSRKGVTYEVVQGGKIKQMQPAKITINLLSLYTQEPVGIRQVYCEMDERFANITRTSDGGYKVYFKNGDSSCYFYDKGICNRVIVRHTFYSAEIVLNP